MSKSKFDPQFKGLWSWNQLKSFMLQVWSVVCDTTELGPKPSKPGSDLFLMLHMSKGAKTVLSVSCFIINKLNLNMFYYGNYKWQPFEIPRVHFWTN